MYVHRGGYRFVPAEGKPIWLGTDYTEALKRYADLVGSMKSGRPQLRTLSDVMDRYLAEIVPNKAESTQKTNRQEMERLRAFFGSAPPGDVTPQHIYLYLDRRPNTRGNREKALLSHVFTHAIRWGVVTVNPVKGVMGNKEKPRDRYVTDEEFWAVYELAGARLKVAMLLALSCGFRASEVCGLRWEQVHEGHISIRRGKGGKRQEIERNTWIDAALEMARGLRRGPVTRLSPYVLAGRQGEPWKGLNSAWGRVMKAWGGERFTFHDLRAKSASDHESGKHLGHQSPAVLEKHYRRKPERVRGLGPE